MKPVHTAFVSHYPYDVSAHSSSSGHPYNPPHTLSLLDEMGWPAGSVSVEQVQHWRRVYTQGRFPTWRKAWAALRLGEYVLGWQKHPQAALPLFGAAYRLSRPRSVVHGLAAYDAAVARYHEGAYAAAAQAFAHLLAGRLWGYPHQTASLWLRHCQACAGFHQQRAKMGIPEPPQLDPLCGASGLAVWLKAHGRPFSKSRLLQVCHVTGEGSSLGNIVAGAEKLGLVAKAVTADKVGLCLLPKPLVAYVERDHFVAVVKADRQGVTYICSDCGPWPGGAVQLTWRQWQLLEPGPYAVFAEPGTSWAKVLASLKPTPSSSFQVATRASLVGALGLSGLFGSHIRLYVPPLSGDKCGGLAEAQHCPPYIQCPMDCPAGGPFGASAGDPVNLATGEEEYTPSPDLVVYNPLGPSVVWERMYNSLRGPYALPYSYQNTPDFGVGWSHPYNVGVYATGPHIAPPQGAVSPNTTLQAMNYVVFANGSRVQAKPSTAGPPSASTPRIVCSVAGGVALLVEWDYDSTTGGNYFKVTFPDRSVWQTVEAPSGTVPSWYPVGREYDRVGNFITLQYGTNGALNAIVDKNGSALLTINRDGNGTITSVSDRYGRSVYYHVGSYPTQNVPAGYAQAYYELDHVSQVVSTGTPNPPNRYVYGYANVANGEGSETIPLLHTISVPSPTGNGMATATINYQPNTDYVSSRVDANGNTVTYTVVDGNHTKVSYLNPQGQVVFSQTRGFDNNMSATTETDGTNQTVIEAFTYADPNDPYAPSVVQDGNGYASGGANGKGTWEYTYDGYGHVLTETTPYGTTITSTYTYTNFALGELVKVQEGGKTPTSYTYYEPSGLLASVSSPLPGTSGSGQVVTTTYSYDALGNLVQEVGPGNNAAQTETTTYGYTQDGNYQQAEALGEPLTITDNLGHTVHHRYDARGNRIADIDALGNEIDLSYNLADQLVQITFPATGQTGAGHSAIVYSYLYVGGSQTAENHYDESGNLVRHVTYGWGLEGEFLGASGDTNPYQYSYDAAYRLVGLTDANGHTITYSYNSAGYLAQVTYPNGDSVQYPVYDADGSPLERIDGRGLVTTYQTNDPESQLTDIQYQASPALNVHFSYDAYGRRIGMTDGTGTTSYSYDDLDNVTSETRTFNGLPAQTLSYSYYPDGSLQSLDTPAGSFTYSYDGAGRLVSETNPLNETTNWSYLANDWLWTRALSNGVVTGYTYNALGQITNVTNKTGNGTLLSAFGMSYNGLGDCVTMSSTVSTNAAYSGTTSYSYDRLEQLLSEQSTRNGGYTESFGYDGVGNPTTFRRVGQTYNADNQNVANTYDGDGNPVVYKGVGMSYDPENRLVGVGSSWSAGYDGDGLRVWKQVNGVRTYYLNVNDVPLVELDGKGNVVAVNTFGADGLVSRHTGSGDVFYVFDGLGNVCQRMDGLGNVLSSSFYDGYGQGVGLVSGEPFGYGGQWGYYTDGEVGFTLLGLRYYDGGCGRFLTRDPWFEVSDNLYRYTENNPVNLHDPTGLKPKAVTPLCAGHLKPQKQCPTGYQWVCVSCYGVDNSIPYYSQRPHQCRCQLSGCQCSNPLCSCYGIKMQPGICAIGGDHNHPEGCGPGKGAIIIKPDGTKVPCHICDKGNSGQSCWNDPRHLGNPQHIDLCVNGSEDEPDCGHSWKTQWYCVHCSAWPIH
jgi:RHS repeat-associated protein